MDFTILEWISNHRPAGLDGFFLAVSQLGSVYLPIIIICTVFWCCEKKDSTRMMLSVLFSISLNQILKLVFLVKRPWLRSEKVIPVEKALADATGYSFPSGHSTNAAALAGSVSYLKIPKWIKISAWVLALLVCASRLYLCVHTPTDVVVGFVSTLFIVYIAGKFTDKLFEKPSLDIPLLIFCALLMAATLLLAFIQPEEGTGTRLDIIKLSGVTIGAMAGWFWDRRKINSAPAKNIKSALLRCLPGIIVLFAALEGSKGLFNAVAGETIGSLLRYGLATFAAFGVWPFIYTKAGF